MAYTTDTALLADINDTIQRIKSGGVQEYRVGQRWVKYLPLKELEEEKARLERKLATPAVRSGVALARFRRASS